MENSERRTSVPRSVFFVIFTISGFAGLIYESIWSHYLKLFLGHAAYAQTLVLAIFMGGMAIGARVCARYTDRWKNLLIGYAIAEMIIGLLAITFHGIFVGTIAFAYDSLFPALESPAAVNLIKWLIAAVLILPQSILLGMTFPLMSAGIMRLYPQTPGASLAMLYFTNSLGAAVGVLASGFFLIEKFGMPGTLLTAGLLNVALAIAVWATEKRKYLDVIDAAPSRALETSETGEASKQSLRLLLVVSMVTGIASFCYEIGWIRMLSLVLGSSTHAFEIMLSAFIFGIAFGGLWIKGRIDHAKSLIGLLGMVLAAKGVLALATLPVYGNTFELMRLTISALAKTDFAYTSFNISSHLISLSVMFPAAFCAGMSLPLITFSLLRDGHGEASIGKVYAWNTLGAIIGVLFAVHIGMPMLGLKNLIVVGAILDIGIALVLVAKMRDRPQSRLFPAMAVIGCLAIVTSLFVVRFDTDKMASGVYRHGKLKVAGDGEVIFHRDGKTATVDVIKSGPLQSILTNGKTDAAIFMSGEGMAGDEPTMVMLGALPLAHKPGALKVANIG
ncbi:MAG: spermidine synthase, partial [Prolixibacteraceae bacterium]|nr:spermidine synthase [Burkholderiales bacterium]